MNRSSLISRRLFTSGTVLAAATLAWPSLRAQPSLEKTKIALVVAKNSQIISMCNLIITQICLFVKEFLWH